MFSRQLILLVSCSCWWLVLSNSISEKPQDGYSDGGSPPPSCLNCTYCQDPCTPLPPPPPPPPPSEGQIYTAPPPPAAPVEVNCPPAAPVVCCQNTPPMPYNNYPPNYGNYSDGSSTPPFSLVLLLFPFAAFLFRF